MKEKGPSKSEKHKTRKGLREKHRADRLHYSKTRTTKAMAEVALGNGIEPRLSTRRHSQNSSIWSRYRTQGGGGSAGSLVASSDRTSPLHLALGYLRDRFNHTHLNRQQHLYAGVVSFQSEASTVTPVDANQPDLHSGGGVGGSDHNKGEGESDEHNKKKMAISMSQKFTLGYAALLGGSA